MRITSGCFQELLQIAYWYLMLIFMVRDSDLEMVKPTGIMLRIGNK